LGKGTSSPKYFTTVTCHHITSAAPVIVRSTERGIKTHTNDYLMLDSLPNSSSATTLEMIMVVMESAQDQPDPSGWALLPYCCEDAEDA
jgi:hypothetical protein